MNSRKYQITLFAICMLVVSFVLGIMFYQLVWRVPISEAKYQSFELAAQSIYEQRQNGNTLLEIPDGINYEISNQYIIVYSNQEREKGKVTAKIENGNLVMNRQNDDNSHEQIYWGLGGQILSILPILLFSIFISEKSDKKNYDVLAYLPAPNYDCNTNSDTENDVEDIKASDSGKFEQKNYIIDDWDPDDWGDDTDDIYLKFIPKN